MGAHPRTGGASVLELVEALRAVIQPTSDGGGERTVIVLYVEASAEIVTRATAIAKSAGMTIRVLACARRSAPAPS